MRAWQWVGRPASAENRQPPLRARARPPSYSTAVAEGGRSADAFIKRSAAHTKLNHFEEALEDANVAVGLDPENYVCHYRKG